MRVVLPEVFQAKIKKEPNSRCRDISAHLCIFEVDHLTSPFCLNPKIGKRANLIFKIFFIFERILLIQKKFLREA